MFALDLLDLPKLDRIDGEYRLYRTPEGELLPSVTTILGAMSDKSGLDEWRERVGEEQATRVGNLAAKRGTEVHRLCEKYVLNEPIDFKREMPSNVMLFRQLQRQLDKHMNNVRGSELFLYSDKLRVAGACDLIAEWDGTPSIIDFKTSNRPKERSWILGYFQQTSLYSWMFYERTGLMYSNLVVAIAVDDSNEAQVFTGNIKDYLPEVKEICKKFHSTVDIRSYYDSLNLLN